MALFAKREGVKQVPWFSLTEWHQVYKEVYSNDTIQQTRAYETLLAWKARMPKLPMGVDCTLSILQVCLRDREWTPKIDSGELPISYENDLCLMYSTTIMRILNHITNIGNTKQTSLFEIAKHINIPKWIVSLRHDTAHAHELPSIGVLRIAINILLTWLHEEYWVAETKALEDYYSNDVLAKEAREAEEAEVIRDLLDLWISIKLYMHSGYSLVLSLPDSHLRDTLQDLRLFALEKEGTNGKVEGDKYNYLKATVNLKSHKKYKLETAKIIVMSEISRYFRRKSIPNKEDIFFNTLFSTETFLTANSVLSLFMQSEKSECSDLLPKDMILFWEDIICIIQETNMMEPFILRLLKLVYNEGESKQLRAIASSWICTIFYSFVKLEKAQEMLQSMESGKEDIEPIAINIKTEIDNQYPQYAHVLWWDISCIIPQFLMDMNFVSQLVVHPNEYSLKLIPPLLELATPNIELSKFEKVMCLAKKYILGLQDKKPEGDQVQNNDNTDQYFTAEDLSHYQESEEMTVDDHLQPSEFINPLLFGDRKVRNTLWKLGPENNNWKSCSIGILPWQVDSIESLKPLEAKLSKCHTSSLESEIVPGILTINESKKSHQVIWENVLRKKRRQKRKYEKGHSGTIVNEALKIAKKQKYAK